MLRRVLLAGFLLVAGVPMLGSAQTTPLGVLLLAVGLSTLAVPSYLRRSRTH
jgi:hypothetical protein